MAFCTQRKFPGQSYENNGLADINPMKGYTTIGDHRAWSIDQNQRTSYLVDAVHKGEGDTINFQDAISTRVAHCKNRITKISKRVSTVDSDGCPSVVNRCDSLRIFELSMELEESKLKIRTLKNENGDLRKRIANMMPSDHECEREENMQNHLQIIENLIAERNDLRELLDKFLGVTDQIIELKVQADLMKNTENEYILLQTKFKEHERELETLRNERKTFEERMQVSQTTNVETDLLKEANSKLEKDLFELSSMVSVSDNLIHDQENEIKSNLHIITEQNIQIENLRIALSEAEMKLNKKMRLEMDVELMEKELSIMIENSADSNPHNQQVIDRQVEDLATAIKLTLGCMNSEFENSEDDNLVEANRKLKTLLLESSNKILEFKDVINKQEQNLMKVANDFACKNDELTECLATVEELKRQIALEESGKPTDNNKINKILFPNVQKVAVNDAPIGRVNQEREEFENEINLADFPQMSEGEDDGQEIDDLENIFEKSCIQQERADVYQPTSVPKGLEAATRLSEEQKRLNKATNDSTHLKGRFISNVANIKPGSHQAEAKSSSADVSGRLSDKIEHMSSDINDLESKNNEMKGQIKEKSTADNQNEKGDDPKDIEQETSVTAAHPTNEEFADLQHKLNDMTSEINNLQITNDELRDTIRLLQRSSPSKHSPLKSTSQLLHAASRRKLSTNRSLETGSQNEKLKSENPDLLAELKNVEDQARTNIANKQKEIETLKSIIEKLEAGKQIEKTQIAEHCIQDSDRMPTELKVHPSEHADQKTTTTYIDPDSNSITINKESASRQSSTSIQRGRLSTKSQQYESDLLSSGVEKSIMAKLEAEFNDTQIEKAQLTDIGEMRNEIEKIKLEKEKLISEMNDLKNSKHCAQINLLEMEKDVQKLTSINEKLRSEINNKSVNATESSELCNQDQNLKNLIAINEELAAASEEVLRKIIYSEHDAQTSCQSLTPMHRNRLTTKSHQYESDLFSSGAKKIENENVNLKLENEKLVVEIGKLKDFENSSHLTVMEMKKEMAKLATINEQLAADLAAKKLLLDKKIDAMPPDLRDLVLKNEELRSDNEKLLLKIRCLEQGDQTLGKAAPSNDRPEPSNLLGENEENTEPDWVPSNEDLVAEIEKLQQSKDKANMSIRQMEKDLKRLESINENLVVQLRDKEAESKRSSMTSDVEYIRRQNDELKNLNGNLTAEINALKNSEQLARSNEIDMKKELEHLVDINRTLMTEINELKSTLITETETMEQIKAINDGRVLERADPISPENRSNLSILKIGKDLERLAALNESVLAINDIDLNTNTKKSVPEGFTLDVNQQLKQNQELKNANEILSTKISELKSTGSRAHYEAIDSKNQLETLAAANERLQAQIKDMERLSSNDRIIPSDLHALRNENDNLKSTNDNLRGQIAQLEDKLKNIENRTARYLSSSLQTSSEEQQSTSERIPTTLCTDDALSMEMDWMVADMKKLQSKNETLKVTNQKLLSQISELQSCTNRANVKETVDNKGNDAELIYASDRNIEIEWMKADMDVLHKKNEKLKITNESLNAEIGALKSADTRTHKTIQQMERDLLRLSAINERLSTQLNDKRQDKKQMPVRSQELLKKIDELTNSNKSLESEINELKSFDTVKMRIDLKKLSSTNESLKLQISELKLLSSSDHTMESNWMAADMKKLLNRNKKLSASNQNHLNEIDEMRREFKSLENRANLDALQKIKEIERLTALVETLKEQQNTQKTEKKNCKCNEIGSGISVTEVKKVHKKNEELKAANEKLLSVIINLKSAERLANSRVVDLDKELIKLRDTNRSLQDTLENYVERDWNWSKPKTELEQICQSILNEGVSSLTDAELHYMHKWFCKTATAEYETAKSSRKNTNRKHCKYCHKALNPFDNNCDCRQFEERKRLDLLKEIEKTKLAIQHIQKSSDIEFELNDVKNRLQKGKTSDQSDDDSQYDLKMSQSQGKVNVRAHITTRRGRNDRH